MELSEKRMTSLEITGVLGLILLFFGIGWLDKIDERREDAEREVRLRRQVSSQAKANVRVYGLSRQMGG